MPIQLLTTHKLDKNIEIKLDFLDQVNGLLTYEGLVDEIII